MKTVFRPELLGMVLATGLLVGQLASAAPAAGANTSSAQTPSLSLEQFLQQVTERNGNFRALKSSQEASISRRIQGDLELAPMLTASVQSIDDKKPQILGAFNLTGNKTQEASLGIAKKFSTGTEAQISASVTETTTGFQVINPPTTTSTTNAFGALGISVSQSLWKNFFGEGTDLRRERELLIEKTESQGLDLQSRQIIINAESAYWDHLYKVEELRQRQESLARAKRIETWVKNRASNGIGDRADVLNAQGLVAGRELQVLNARDEVVASEATIRDMLELSREEAVPRLQGNLGMARNLQTLVDGKLQSADGAMQVVRLDAYLSVLEAQTKAVVAREVSEGVKPDLVLSGTYRTNSVDTSLGGAGSQITDPSKPTSVVGLKFTYLLDNDLKNASRNTAKMEALAAQQKQSRKILESRTSWDELRRRHTELTQKIVAAEKASQIQLQKADAERDRLSKGRAITSTVILAEEDAAESQLTLTRMRAEQRKLESQGRLFIQISEQLVGAK